MTWYFKGKGTHLCRKRDAEVKGMSPSDAKATWDTPLQEAGH